MISKIFAFILDPHPLYRVFCIINGLLLAILMKFIYPDMPIPLMIINLIICGFIGLCLAFGDKCNCSPMP